MRDRQMLVRVSVRRIAGIRKVVVMLMMRIVNMTMRVRHPLVRMRVRVALAHMQPDAEPHAAH
jgi:hypothetical protein